MKGKQEIIDEVVKILSTNWTRHNGKVVPEVDQIRSDNYAVLLSGTVLYADIHDSTGLVEGFKDWFAAEIYKSYLKAAAYIVRNNGGEITAFDGDRIMAVYTGSSKNSSAAKTALQLNLMVSEINNRIKIRYANTSYQIQHGIGIDTGDMFAAKTGIRDNNDIVWVGSAANYAAKLCNLSIPSMPIIITDRVFNMLSDETKNGGTPRRLMWTKGVWPEKKLAIYQSNWTWNF